jgi:peptide/nickel transport system substrate-binding protein
MIETSLPTESRRRTWVPGLLMLITVFIVACGAAAPAAPAEPQPPASVEESPSGTGGDQPAPAEQPTPTPVPQATSTPAQAADGRNEIVVVTEAEPDSVGAWSEGCSAEIHSMGCQDFVTDFLTWIDDSNNEVVLLSGIESYEQMAPDRWRWKIRPGVKFHNGAPFNAAAAKFGLEYNAIPANVSAAVTWLGPDIKGEVVDELTFDLVCPQACPIAPRAGIFTDFQDPEWFQNADEAERSGMTIGFGPYRIIDYQPGVHTRFEAYTDYLPNENFFAQSPSIQFITHTYRAEATVRASMLTAGEADWAADVGFDNEGQVPQAKSGKTAEVYTLVLDTIWHPELKKQKVRLALAHAIDCEGLLQSLFGDRVPCHGAISAAGTVGITPENSTPREYNPELSRQLLAEAGYDPANAIDVNTRPGSNIRGLELMEATVSFWREVGVTSNLNSWGDLGKARDIQNSGCGNFSEEPGYRENMDCAQREPPGPYFASSHAYEIATSNEILDMQRFNQSRLSCFNRSSRVCIPEFQAQLDAANAIPEGPERTQAMIEIANIAYEQVYFIPFFEVVMVYGLSDAIEWEPYYAPRLRGNTIRFKQ